MSQENHPDHDWNRAEERFRLLVDSVRDYAILMLDPEGYVVSWNAGARRLKGYEADEIIGSHFSCFYLPEDIAKKKPQRELAQALAEGRVEDEGWRVRKNGSRFWANVVITALRDPETDELRGYGKVTRDLTERKLAEERLRDTEEQFRSLVEGVEEYAIFALDATGRVVTWNSGAERCKGYTAREIIGEHFERFYTADDRASGKPARLLAEARLMGSVKDQGLRVRKDGTTFHADVLITAIRDADGNLRGFSKVTRDITDQVHTQKLEAAKIAAEKANKAKDEFLAVLSHELRTPLTPVVAGIGYLVDNISSTPPAEASELLKTVRKNVLLEAQLIDDLLDLTRISRGQIEMRFEPVDIHAALHDVLQICHEAIQAKDFAFSVRLDATDHWAWADSTRIRQVFWNLINNAVKFTPSGGCIFVSTASDPAGGILVEVADTGVGLEPGQAEKIFNAFEQGDRTVNRQFGGLGLGLAITRNLVEMHQGSISVHSEGPGKGTLFAVRLATIPHQAAEESHRSPAALQSHLRILLVDDHDDTRRILSRLLLRQGHQVEVATSVQTGLMALGKKRFDVLVSDIGLPDGSGNELMTKAREQQPDLHGIAVSGFGMEEDVKRSTTAGFDAHLTKPVNVDVLNEHLQRIATNPPGTSCR